MIREIQYMKVIFTYPNGTKYSYKGFSIDEMIIIINENYEFVSFQCIGWEWGNSL